MKQDLPTSTVAYSVYQAICQGGPAELHEILARLEKWVAESRVRVTTRQVQAALSGLIRRGRAREILHTGVFDVNDPQRRYLVGRDREGDGWSGWKVQPFRRELTPSVDLAEAIKQCNTEATE